MLPLSLSLLLLTAIECNAPLKVVLNMGLGTLSHIKPLFEMGTVLRERNHTVVYSAYEEYERFNKPYGFQFLSLGKSSGVPPEWQRQMKEFYLSREFTDIDALIFQSFGSIAPLAYESTYVELGRVLDQEQPDVVICDFISTACRDLAEMKGIPLVTGFQTVDYYGTTESSFITNSLSSSSITTEALGFGSRFYDKVIAPILLIRPMATMTKAMNQVRTKFGVPVASAPFGDFTISLGLANTFFGLEPASNIPPNIKLIGPIRSNQHSPLTPDVADFLEGHPRTLYVAFGSAVSLAEFDVNNLIVGSLTALAEGSIDGILWGLGKTLPKDFPASFSINGTEYSQDHLLKNQHPHLRFLDWAPQTAILEHKNTRLFISHGGIESLFEAIFSETPVLSMPFLGDQLRNSRKIVDAGIGKYIDRRTATPLSLTADIHRVLADEDGKIASNLRRMQILAQMGSRREEAGADAIEEYVYTAQACRPLFKHRYGEIPCELKHLTMASRNMSYIKANLIDVYSVACLLVVSVIVGGLHFIRLLISSFSSSTKHVGDKKNQ